MSGDQGAEEEFKQYEEGEKAKKAKQKISTPAPQALPEREKPMACGKCKGDLEIWFTCLVPHLHCPNCGMKYYMPLQKHGVEELAANWQKENDHKFAKWSDNVAAAFKAGYTAREKEIRQLTDKVNELERAVGRCKVCDGFTFGEPSGHSCGCEDFVLNKINFLEYQLEEAAKYLRIGKNQFAPHTTNSDVDMFLARLEKRQTDSCPDLAESAKGGK